MTANIRLLVVNDQVLTLRRVPAFLKFSGHIAAIQQAAIGCEALAAGADHFLLKGTSCGSLEDN